VQKFVNHQGKRVAYNVSGKGPTLVLLHGFGFDARLWETMLPLLTHKLKVVTPYLPGTGQSDTPDGTPTMEAMADAVAAIIKEEGGEPCRVIGHSMGGYVALALVERHPKWVSAFGLFHSHPFSDDEPKKAKRDKDIDFVQRNGSAAYIKVLLPALFADSYKKQYPEIINALVDRYKDLSPDGLIYALQAMRDRLDRSNVVSSSANPFLLISGVEDQVVTLETVSRIYKMPQYTFGLFIRQAAHMAMIESPDACARHILGWTAT
jgi:pimeloyl-ACP methyl ester carboxylesterase